MKKGEIIEVPFEILIEVLTQITEVRVAHQIRAVSQQENTVMVLIADYQSEEEITKAVNNIKQLINKYKHYRHYEINETDL